MFCLYPTDFNCVRDFFNTRREVVITDTEAVRGAREGDASCITFAFVHSLKLDPSVH